MPLSTRNAGNAAARAEIGIGHRHDDGEVGLAMRLIQILRPLITQSLPSLTARVFMPAGRRLRRARDMAMAEAAGGIGF